MAMSKENIEKTKRAIREWQEEYAKMSPEERAVVDDPNYGLNFLLKYMLMDDVIEETPKYKRKVVTSQEREEFYTTVILSLEEIPSHEMTMSGAQSKASLCELLPMNAKVGSKFERLVRGILLNETDEPMDEETAEKMFVGFADVEETKRLYQAVMNAQTEGEWQEAMQDFGWHCLDRLEPIWTENLIDNIID